MYPLDFDWSVLIFSFLCSLFLCLSLSLLPLWYLCIGSCPGDRTHKHCGGRQEVLWNHNGVTAALRSLSSPPLLSLPLSASASMHAIILSRAIHSDHTSLSLPSLSFLSLLLALLFQLSPALPSTLYHSILPQYLENCCLICGVWYALVLVDVLKSCWAVLNISTCPTTGRQVEKLTPVL